jgi:hypothetical protein
MATRKPIVAGLITAGLLAFLPHAAQAAVSGDEAKALGTTLTKFGAEKAGNADGSIPAYEGGLTKAPAGHKPDARYYVDPFEGEKPVLKIDASNVSKYESMLTEGTKEALKRFPDSFRVDVYPTRRTMAYADWVLDNTVKNATTANLAGTPAGNGVSGGDNGNPFPGIPFPIPKNGFEVMWNHQFRYTAPVIHTIPQAFLIDTGGNASKIATPDEYFLHPWYEKSGELRKLTFDALHGFTSTLQDPPSSAGIVFLNYYMADGDQKVWFYTPGQRRVRTAPEFAYDIPIASYGGVLLWDEIHGFTGRMDRFDFKLVGKKEMYVPYNVFGITNTVSSKDFIMPKHANPDSVRFEKRRVYVVDAVRKGDARHVYSRRTFYIEEDCWCIVQSESYDNAGALWRTGFIYTFPTYDFGGIDANSWGFIDFIKGNHFLVNVGRKDEGRHIKVYADHKGLNMKLTPQAVASGSVR